MLDRKLAPRAVLMDIDGSLLDSAEAQTQCWLSVLREFGYSVDYQQVRARIGMGHDRILRDLCGVSVASPRAQRLLPVRELLLRREYLPWLKPIAGVAALIQCIRGSGASLAAVTSCSRSEAFALLGAGRLLTEFDHVVCTDDVPHTKPEADGLRFALARIAVRPEQALVIASSPHDVAAANAAGVPCVAVGGQGWPASALLGGLAVYEGLTALQSFWEQPRLQPHAA
jgi:HAD superfamily hydrolase (TIGR01509 family)